MFQDGVLKHGKHVLPGARDTLVLLANTTGHLTQPVPYLLMTNGGGMTEADRLKALEKDFGLPVSRVSLLVLSGDKLTLQLTENQLVQSHTPLRDYVARYADRPVLVCGGRGDAGRRIARSYGLNRPYLLQDVVAWRGSVWDRYELSEQEEGFVQVCAAPHLRHNPSIRGCLICAVLRPCPGRCKSRLPHADLLARHRLCLHAHRSRVCHSRRRPRLGVGDTGDYRGSQL